MILDDENQRVLLVNILNDFPVSGNYEQIKQATLNLGALIKAVQDAEIQKVAAAENPAP